MFGHRALSSGNDQRISLEPRCLLFSKLKKTYKCLTEKDVGACCHSSQPMFSSFRMLGWVEVDTTQHLAPSTPTRALALVGKGGLVRHSKCLLFLCQARAKRATLACNDQRVKCLAIGPCHQATIKGSALNQGAYFSVSSKRPTSAWPKKMWERAATLASLIYGQLQQEVQLFVVWLVYVSKFWSTFGHIFFGHQDQQSPLFPRIRKRPAHRSVPAHQLHLFQTETGRVWSKRFGP